MEHKKVITLNHVEKKYFLKNKTIEILDNINISFENGKLYAFMGHSGSGKSTLVRILGLLDKVTSGKYFLFNYDVANLKDNQLAYLRMKNIGFIFQDFHLHSYLKAYENVILPMLINKDIEKKERYSKALKLLNNLGLKERINHFPNELSGGEQQRVAIARALANDPNIILADEPTGNLDETMEKEIFKYLRLLADQGKCVIVVSHSNEIKKYADKILILKNNGIVGESNEDS